MQHESSGREIPLTLLEAALLKHLASKHAVPLSRIVAQFHRNRVEAQMLASLQGVGVADVYRQRISQLQARLKEFE